MDDKELKYSHVLYKIKKITPVLDGAEQLTENIMRRVEQTISNAENHCAKKEVISKKNRVIRIGGILSGVAASALICLLAYDSLRYPVLPMEKITEMKQRPLFENMQRELNSERKVEFIENKLKSRELQRAQKERLISVFVNRINHSNIKYNESE